MQTLTYFYCMQSTCNKLYSGTVTLHFEGEGLNGNEFGEVKERLALKAEECSGVSAKNWAITAFNRI